MNSTLVANTNSNILNKIPHLRSRFCWDLYSNIKWLVLMTNRGPGWLNGCTLCQISSRAQVRVPGRLMVFHQDPHLSENSDYGSYNGAERGKRLN